MRTQSSQANKIQAYKEILRSLEAMREAYLSQRNPTPSNRDCRAHVWARAIAAHRDLLHGFPVHQIALDTDAIAALDRYFVETGEITKRATMPPTPGDLQELLQVNRQCCVAVQKIAKKYF